MIEEKRIYKRVTDAVQVKYEVDANIIPKTSYTKDISEGGILFNTNTILPIDSIIKVKFFIKDSQEFIPATAKVIRIEEIVENKLYEVGIKFIDIETQDFKKLTGYVAKNLD
jgi:c-di-GMP-binding flagellar brake protein YcgR